MHKQHGILSSLLLALVLAAGTAIVWGVVGGFCGDVIRQRQLRQRPATERVHEQLVVAEDGTPLVAITYLDRQYRAYRTLDGELVESATQANRSSLPGPDALERYSLFVEWSARICGVSDNQVVPRYWYLIHDGRRQGHAWLEGFDSITKHRLGYIGRHGFRTTPPTADDLFPMDGRVFRAASGFGYPRAGMPYWRATAAPGVIPTWIGYLVTDGKLVEVDVRTGRLRTLIHDPGLIGAAVVDQIASDDTERRSSSLYRRFVAARSADRLWIVDPRTNQSRQYAIPGHLRRSTLEIYLVGDEILLTDIDRSYRTNTASLVWLDRGGRVLRERTVAVRAPQSLQPGEWTAVAMVPVPTILALAAFVSYPLEQIDSGATATYGEGLVAACRRFRGAIVAVSLAAIALAAWCFRRHKRYAHSGAWVWCAFVLLLGVPGLIGYLLHRRWPVFETCSACGRRVVGDRETCQACGAAFPTPPPIGTEVFA